jgi:hypothetical protein
MPAMRSDGLREDAGWWAVGAWLALMVIPTLVAYAIADAILPQWFGRSWLLLLGWPGISLGDWLFHSATRGRYLRRRQGSRK